jgi:L-lactate dehydrogenase complex protein LldG
VLRWDEAHIPVKGLTEALQQHGIAQADDHDASVHIGITGADSAIASTCSLVLQCGDGKPRTVSLLPYVHVAVVRAEQLLPNMEAWYKQQADSDLNAFRESSMTNIVSGASRTADIGMELVQGAHGPAELHCIVIG